ncbi:SpaA isopeptide-forming pilin-related protein [Clostridium sp. LP20]|uniref:SpaA isopeptide-forming pilin-related protein n=1 Tax=Clostridium sp. LP20 TaxID=3418665 RepID=UPI003EE7118F
MKKTIKKQAILLLIISIISLLMPFNVVSGVGAIEEKEQINLGTIANYNGVIFGNHTATGADTEGALAVERNSDISVAGFSYGANFEYYDNVQVGDPIRDDFKVALLIEGKIIGDKAKGIIRDDGKAVVNDKNEQEAREVLNLASEGTDIISLEENILDKQFDKFRLETQNLENNLESFMPGKNGKNIISDESGPVIELEEATTNKKVLVSDEEDLSSIGTLFFNDLSKYSTVIIKSKSEEINFDNGSIFYNGNQVAILPHSDLLKELAPKVVWYFPNAKHITIDGGYAVVGSVIAPEATLDGNSGNVNGQAILKNLNQKSGFELHNFYHNIPEEDTGNCILQKVDNETGESLQGAEFRLLSSNGELLEEGLVTDEDGILEIKDLLPGDYQVIETKAPDGYELDSTPLRFTINPDVTKEIKLTMENKKKEEIIKKGSVKLKKVDSETGEGLQGAEFKLLSSGGELLQERLVTDKSGILKIKDLVSGDYQLIETKAPDGYELDSTPLEFTINPNVTKEIKLTMKNKKRDIVSIKNLVKLIKVDEEVRQPLSGVEFKLVDLNDNIVREQLFTDENGIIEIENLVPGEYKLIEIKALDGYVLDSSPIDFDIDNNEEINLEKTNKKEKNNSVDNISNKPKTSDNNNLIIYIVSFILATLLIILITIRYKNWAKTK